MGKVTVVVGGQFGSEGKGGVCDLLSRAPHTHGVRVAGPNAGHTVVDDLGVKWPLRSVPVAAVSNRSAKLWVAPGSELDPEVFNKELAALDAAGLAATQRTFVDPQVTVLDARHIEQEAAENLQGRVGSTGKGIGAARADRLWRKARLAGEAREEFQLPPDHFMDVPSALLAQLQQGEDLVIEGTQGYGLGLHAGFYPQCTSSDCRAIDFLAMAGLSPWHASISQLEVIVCLRTYPIRVAGNSGPLAGETTWEELGRLTNGYIQPEQTTVTHKTRRVGHFDPELARRAVEANGGAPTCSVALTFFDYWYPELAGCSSASALRPEHLRRVEEVSEQAGAPVSILGTGPRSWIRLIA